MIHDLLPYLAHGAEDKPGESQAEYANSMESTGGLGPSYLHSPFNAERGPDGSIAVHVSVLADKVARRS